jgi:hypothetical protein
MSKAHHNPFFGVDGNLLVEDLDFSSERVESILNGTFKPSFMNECMLPCAVYDRYPQLRDEREKRLHRKAYKAHLQAKLQELKGSAPRPGC